MGAFGKRQNHTFLNLKFRNSGIYSSSSEIAFGETFRSFIYPLNLCFLTLRLIVKFLTMKVPQNVEFVTERLLQGLVVRFLQFLFEQLL